MRYKQKAVIEFLMRENEKLEIHKCLKYVYGEDILMFFGPHMLNDEPY